MWLCEKPWMKRIPGRRDCPNPAPKWSGHRVSSPRSVCISIPVRNSAPPLWQATKWQRSPSAGSEFAAILSSEILPRVADYIFKYVLEDQAVLTVAKFAWAVKHDRIGNYSPRGKPNRNRFGRSLPRGTSPWLTLGGGPSVTGLPITLLKRADELCIGQYVALHCSLDLRFRRVS